MVLLQRSWPCSRYRPQPTALPRAREMHSRASGGGDMLTLCVPRCLAAAIFCPDVSQKRPRTGKRPLPGNISPPCIQNELALARSARHVSGAQVLPRFSFRKALRMEGKRSWVSQAHFVLRPTAPPPWLHTSAVAMRNHGSCRSVAGGANP